jgi:polysaccharide biosynthesis protein PslG
MSRYSFNPKIDPGRDHKRRTLIGAIALGAVLIIGIVLFIIGIRELTGGGGGGSNGSQATAQANFVPAVTIYALDGTPQADMSGSVAAATVSTDTGAISGTAATVDTSVPQTTPDPLGAISGLADFTCPSPHAATDKFGYGIQSNWPVGDIGYWNSVMSDKLKVGWTKAQVRWKDFQPDQNDWTKAQNNWQLLDAFTADANKKGLSILYGIMDAPEWSRTVIKADKTGPPDDFTQAAAFFKKVIARYKGCVQAIEVWNEMNIDREWTTPAGSISAADYVKLLNVVVPAIRAVDPNIMIVMGALAPTGITKAGESMDDFAYMDQFVAAGGPAMVDCIGVHLNGYNMPPDKEWNAGYNDPTAKFRGPFDNPNHSWSFKSTLFGYYQRTNKPQCVTEFGWASMENLGVQGNPPGFEFALDNTEKEQSDWIVQGFQIMRDAGFVKFGIVYNLDYIQKIGQKPNEAGGDPATYSIIHPDGSPRPAFDAIAQMTKP